MPEVVYQIETILEQRLPKLRPAQRAGLALWVYGSILAKSATQNAVLAALAPLAAFNTLRQRLREWLYEGKDRARPTATSLEVSACFADLLRWVLAMWQADQLVLALDATSHRDRLAALVISVVYRGCAIPVAWHLLMGNQPGAWNPHWIRLLACLAPAVGKDTKVLVLADRGLWSAGIYRQVAQLGWHPMMRVQNDLLFRPHAGPLLYARGLVQRGSAWVGRGVAFKNSKSQLPATLVALWLPDKEEPCLCLSTLAPEEVAVGSYGLRMWIETGFRVLKRVGWQWEKTRRTDPERASRHWLVLCVATLWVLAAGTREEDSLPACRVRLVSVFRRGVHALTRQLLCGCLWKRLWLKPEPLPTLANQLIITRYEPPDTS